jgi:cytochrome b subunit of formate dehydrogenase
LHRTGAAMKLSFLTRPLPLVALLMAAMGGAAEPAVPGSDQVVRKEACTDGCHEEVVNENAKHAAITCVECHPNIPDGKAEHKGALDDTPSDTMCATAGCHPEATKKTLEGKHKDAPCETCHGTVHDKFVLNDEKACRQCHKEQVLAHQDSMHAKAKKPVTCGNCHGDMHDIKLKKDPLSPMSKVLQVSTCGECHDTEKVRAFRKSVHGQGLLRSGLSVAPTCSSCHGSHDMVKVKDPAARVGRERITETCGQCHTFIVDRWKKSHHGETFLKGTPEEKKKAPVCTDCHSGHETVDPGVDNNALAMVSKCEKCHAEQSRSYRDSFHGKATKLGLGVAATCASCHTPHDMRHAKDPLASVNPAHLKATCQQCHEGANDAFIQFLPHNEPSDPKGNQVLYTIWLFMTVLLTSVLGFFTLHTLLWLQRSIVGFSRHEFDHGHDSKVWIRRFRPVHIWIHLLIITTFLLLSLTGLPLKFSAEPWAQTVAAVMGGAGSARFLHRVAGVLTFGYGFWFVGYLLREIVLRKRRGLLFGWQSMVPNLKDLQDVIANLKWFLYLGPRPRLDRWAYWEKFDFFAVFWGVPVIGFSGLFLWQPMLVTRFLPGWALNIAYLVHSDEALLATGFIFLFHFFHTHLRPEAFPLDPVIFAGAMPLDRFKAERPVEYERLVASGELKNYEVPAPPPHVMRRIYRFGFSFLAVGMVLGVLLITVFFRGLLH